MRRPTWMRDEFHVFGKIFDILNPELPTPDLIIYLHSNLDRLVANIHQREGSLSSLLRRITSKDRRTVHALLRTTT